MDIKTKFTIDQTVWTIECDINGIHIRSFEIKSIAIAVDKDGNPIICYSGSPTTASTMLDPCESRCFPTRESLIRHIESSL